MSDSSTQEASEAQPKDYFKKGHHVNKIFISTSMRPEPRLNEIKRLASLCGVPVLLVERRAIDRLVATRLQASRYCCQD